MWPPTRGSNTVSAIGDAEQVVLGRLEVAEPLGEDLKARSIGASTTICLRTSAVAVSAHDWSSVVLFDDVLVAGQGPVPERVELVAQRHARPG